MTFSPQQDNLVKDIKLLNKKPFYLHGYFAPFLMAYAAGATLWYQHFGIEQYNIGIIIAVGIAFVQLLTVLFCLWSVDVRSFLMYSKTKNVNTASFAKVTPTSHNGSVELLPLQRQAKDETQQKLWIDFQKVTYVYDHEEKKCFVPVQFPVQETFHHYQTWKGYSSEPEFNISKELYGNNVMKMVIPDFKELFVERASAPFFVFQVFCVALWCMDEYWYYSIFTLFMLVAFEASLVYQQLRNMAEIRKMGNKPYQIYTYRYQKWKRIESDELVAGDIVSLTRSGSDEDRSIPCDLLLLRGRLIVDEAMLTGESIPQMKDPIDSVQGDIVLDLSTHSRVHVVSGGTRIVQHDSPAPRKSGSSEGGPPKPPDNGCVGYVLRTGFNTSQGKLLRTILFGVKRVTANNLETFAFIMFLLIFAIAASAYVWIVGSADPKRSQYKLILNCILILTSVVPPELPIELSLAVNSSLIALSKLFVYCTEPFRIPFAGKVDICCFDKTGTLTSDSLVVEGIAGISPDESSNSSVEEVPERAPDLCPVKDAPPHTQLVLATCHALARMDHELVGDPLEQAMLNAVDWNLSKADFVIPKKRRAGGIQGTKIIQRFHFSSLLKRMSTVVSQEEMGEVHPKYFVTVKGAAEVLKKMFTSIPDNYDNLHQDLSRRGARVLALGIRSLGKLSNQAVRDLKREEVEANLTFVGFVIVSSPLKHDSKSIMREIRHSTHYVTMITGDNPLTACHVGKVLRFCTKSACLVLTNTDSTWKWISVDETAEFEVDFKDWKSLVRSNYDLCLTGDGFTYLQSADSRYLNKILPSVRIFARVSPKQKEQVITGLKQLGFVVLMCGDGTNDVGALKHAHVGVALLSNAPRTSLKSEKEKKDEKETKNDKVQTIETKREAMRTHKSRRPGPRPVPAPVSRIQSQQEQLARRRQKLQELVGEMEPDPQIVKMGDASIAAPFSYKRSSIVAVCHIIKQGRCTLVTTLQMFKILALNALVLAYSQSVLFLDGVKFSDGQATLQGLLLAGCFLFISRSKPLKTLSKERPLPNIFNAYTILTITLQFAVHFISLVFLVKEAKKREPRENVDFEADFEANLLNSTVYVLSLATQIITFAINYRGHPFMESLIENRPLLYSLFGSTAFLVCLVTGTAPDLNAQFEIVFFKPEFRLIILQVLGAILVSTWLIDRTLRFLLGAGRLRRMS